MQVARAIGHAGAERKCCRHRQRRSVPGAIRRRAISPGRSGTVAGRSALAVRVHVEVAGKLVSIVHGNFVDTVFVSARVQEVQRVAPENHGFIGQSVGKAKTRTKVVPLGIGSAVSSATRTIAKHVGGAEERLPGAVANGAGIGRARVKEDDLVGRLAIDGRCGERPCDIPAKADINRQLGIDLNVVLHIGCNVKVPQLGLQCQMAEGGFRRSEQKAGKRASGIVEVDSVAGRIAAEVETTSAILAFVVVLVGAAYLKAEIDGVAAMRQKPVIVKA